MKDERGAQLQGVPVVPTEGAPVCVALEEELTTSLDCDALAAVLSKRGHAVQK